MMQKLVGIHLHFAGILCYSCIYICWVTMLQTTLAALSSHSSSQIVPQVLLIWTSTRPFILLVPFTNRTGILATIAVREVKVHVYNLTNISSFIKTFLTTVYPFFNLDFPYHKNNNIVSLPKRGHININ